MSSLTIDSESVRVLLKAFSAKQDFFEEASCRTKGKAFYLKFSRVKIPLPKEKTLHKDVEIKINGVLHRKGDIVLNFHLVGVINGLIHKLGGLIYYIARRFGLNLDQPFLEVPSVSRLILKPDFVDFPLKVGSQEYQAKDVLKINQFSLPSEDDFIKLDFSIKLPEEKEEQELVEESELTKEFELTEGGE